MKSPFDLTGRAALIKGAGVGIWRAGGRLDILVNNTGSAVQCTKIEDCSLEVRQSALDVNLTSAFLVTQRAIPHLRASGNGAIVNNLSRSVQTGGARGLCQR